MAVRTQVYQGLLWQQVIDEKQWVRSQRLPPVLLLVLYNGKSRWSAATRLSELIDLAPDSTLWPWQPQARYFVLDMGAFSKSHLAKRESLSALLFRLEQSLAIELQSLTGEVLEWFRGHQEFAELSRLFEEIVKQATSNVGMQLPATYDLLESKNMLEENLRKWKEECIAEGRHAGRAEGQVQGAAKVLIRLLTARFGSLPLSIQERIGAADLPSLEHWADQGIKAPDLAVVFEHPQAA